MQADVQMKNGKKLKVKVLVDSGCTHIKINEQLVKDKRIQTRPINFSFKVFNADRMKNGEMTKIEPLEIKIDGYKEQLEAAETDLNGTDMFLGYGWLVKYNPKVNWKNRTIKFTRCPGSCRIKHQNIEFKTKRTQTTEDMTQNNEEIRKELDKTNLKDLPDYIWLFTHLFNKMKFKKLLE